MTSVSMTVVVSLGIRHIRRDIRSVQDLPTETRNPLKGRLLNVGFGEGGQDSSITVTTIGNLVLASTTT